MCGRFTQTATTEQLIEEFMLDESFEAEARYNIAPTQTVAAVRESEGKRKLALLKWGLVPSWSKDPTIGVRMINARSETVAEKPSFRSAFMKRRCIVPSTGFYEWQKVDAKKEPYFIGMRGRNVFGIAGLWESWEGPDGYLETCTLLTTSANELVKSIHERMPVILSHDDYGKWFDLKTTADELHALFRPFSTEMMEMYRVDKHVNSPKNDDPSCIAPV